MPRQGEVVLSAAFSKRAEALELATSIDPRRDSGDRLRQSADLLADSATILANGAAAPAYEALSAIFESGAFLLDWCVAVRNATPDPQRFLVAAKQRAADLQDDLDPGLLELLPQLSEAISGIGGIEEPGQVPDALSHLTRIPLPIGVFRVDPPRWTRTAHSEASAPATTEVAVARFYIDGVELSDPHVVAPHVIHDLSIKMKLSGWPSTAEAVRLQFTTIERPEHYEMPEFQFVKPEGEPPFELEDTKRMQLAVAQSFLSRPMEFHYSLHFLPESPDFRSSLEGQRTLHFEALDPEGHRLTGYQALNRHYFELRDALRRFHGPTETERQSFLIVLNRAMQLAAQAKQDGILGSINEAAFQRFVRGWLRDDPAIGGELEEHPHSGRGITDLSFRGIRIELKVENDRVISMDDTHKHLEQAAQYVSTTSKRLGFLFVLECAEKTTASGATSDDIALQFTADGSIGIGVVIVRGNLPRPSDL